MATFRRLRLLELTLFLFLTIGFLRDIHVLAEKKLFLESNRNSQGSDVETGNLAITHVPDSVSFRATAGSIQLQDIPQVISLALGFSSLQDVKWRGLLTGKVFEHPKANILFIIDGLSKGATLPLFSKTQSYPIVKKEAEANLDILRISPSKNFVSHISSILKNKPLVISFSAEDKLAHGSSATGPNAHTVTWDPQKHSFVDSNPNGLTLSKQELLKSFETESFGKDVRYQDGKFIVSVPGIGGTSFDMKQAEDFLFFAQLGMIANLYNKAKDLKNLLGDAYPDFYTFAISSFKGLSGRYGNNSHQVLAALHVLNDFIPQISSRFNELYDKQALIEVVGLTDAEMELSEKQSRDMKELYQAIQDHLQSPSLENFKKTLPEVKLRENLEDRAVAKICESAQSKLLDMHSSFQLNCDASSSEKHIRNRRDLTLEADDDCKNLNLASISDKYDSNYPAMFNIVLWLMVSIGLALYAVCLVLWYMDPGRDSVIYRVTSQRMKTE